MRKFGNTAKSCGLMLLVAAAVMLGAAGCQTVVTSPVGGMVDQEYRVTLLSGGKETGRWEGMYVSVRYDYARDGDKLRLKGKVKYADKIIYNYSMIHYFHIDVLFLDPQGKVLESQPIASTAFDSLAPMGPDPSVSFKRDVILPANTASMAFSYRGEAIASDEDSGGPRYFWEYPVH